MEIVYNRFIERGSSLSDTISEELAQVQDSETVPAFGYELIREVLIRTIGK